MGYLPQTVTIAKDSTLQAQNQGQATIKPSSGPSVQLSGGSADSYRPNLTGAKGVLVDGGNGHKVRRNNFVGNSSGVGLDNQTASQVDATNRAGSSAGPAGAGTDTSGDVLFRRWRDTAIPTCSNLLGAATKLAVYNLAGQHARQRSLCAQPGRLQAVDDLGTLDTSFAGSAARPSRGRHRHSRGHPCGTATVSAVGIASFSGLNVDYVGQSYKLTANTAGPIPQPTAARSYDRRPVGGYRAPPGSTQPPPAHRWRSPWPRAMALATPIRRLPAQSVWRSRPTQPAVLHGTSSKAAALAWRPLAAQTKRRFSCRHGYTLRASSGTSASADSAAFDVAGQAASKLCSAPCLQFHRRRGLRDPAERARARGRGPEIPIPASPAQ